MSLPRLAEKRGIALRRHGADLVGLCPKNLWHCMGACGAGGSVIDWVMRTEGISFRHAVELLRADLPAGAGTGQFRGTSTVYAVADSPAQAAEDLVREWSAERRSLWAIDSGTPARTAAEVEAQPAAPAPAPAPIRAALRHARLTAQRDAIAAAMPPMSSASCGTPPTSGAVEHPLAEHHRVMVGHHRRLLSVRQVDGHNGQVPAHDGAQPGHLLVAATSPRLSSGRLRLDTGSPSVSWIVGKYQP